jgi:hypothetical protein
MTTTMNDVSDQAGSAASGSAAPPPDCPRWLSGWWPRPAGRVLS